MSHPTMHKISGTLLTIQRADGTTATCSFQLPIGEVLATAGIFIVLLELPAGIVHNENVYGVDGDGTTLWQVKPRKYVYDDSPYTGLVCCDNKVKLLNWDGLELLIDPLSGREISQSYGR